MPPREPLNPRTTCGRHSRTDPQAQICGRRGRIRGAVNFKTGKICRSHQIEGWSEFDLRGWLAELTSARVIVDNDANVAALGEALRGAGRGHNPVFYVTLGSGVGGGLVVDRRIYHGVLPGEAEIGHVRLDRAGTTVESRCSGWVVDARIRGAVAQTQTVNWQCYAIANKGRKPVISRQLWRRAIESRSRY